MTPRPMKMKAYDSFADWKEDQSAEHQEIVSTLQHLIDESTSGLTPLVKWGQGCFVRVKSPKLYIHTEHDHVQLGFFNGSTMKDEIQVLKGNGKYLRHVKIRAIKDIDPGILKALIIQAG